jgi:hypothetical protein
MQPTLMAAAIIERTFSIIVIVIGGLEMVMRERMKILDTGNGVNSGGAYSALNVSPI